PVVKSITLSAGTTQLKIGQITQVTAVVRDASGHAISNVPVTFSSSPSAVATVSGGGNVAGVSVGTANVYAKADTVIRSIALSVIYTAASPAPPPPVTSTPATGTTYGTATAATLPQATVSTTYPTMTRQVRVAAGRGLTRA